MKYNQDIEKILLSEEQLNEKLDKLALSLNKFYGNEDVVAIGILKGCLPFYCNLIKRLTFPVYFDFMVVSSYGSGTESNGTINIKKDISLDIKDKNVLIIEDIIDTGNTLYYLKNTLLSRNPKDLRLCCLLDKPSRRTKEINCDFVCEEIDDFFVVGYGLDFDEKYRQLPYIGVLKPEIYTK